MASGPDLFVVCRSCGREVSPYITECPYCGNRLRKRAPKLERGAPKPPKVARRRPSLGRLRPGEIPGIRADRRPYATALLVLASVITTIVLRIRPETVLDLAVIGNGTAEPWRAVTTLFVYTQTGYELVVLLAVALFGWLLERRHGFWAPLLVFFAAGAGGIFLAIAAGDASPVAQGANGAALGLIAAWAVRDLLGRRRGVEDDSDMLGVLAIAVVVVLLPLAADEASAVAGLAGGLIGLILGLGLARLRER
jgi:membrane associated rhomboid family serine protease